MGRVSSKQGDVEAQIALFELGEPQTTRSVVKLKRLRYPIWTENKARLIERYLYYFVLITKHGIYVDGFAGPQDSDKLDAWAARLVLESEPKWLRRFFLCDSGTTQYAALETLRASQATRKPGEPKRTINLYHDDFNLMVDQVLTAKNISGKEATFCLIDQRTFECNWSTVVKLATHKPQGQNKIELFYFLAASWLNRALAAQKDHAVLTAWWGRNDWQTLRSMNANERAELVCTRFKEELGYRSALAWPIHSRKEGGRIHYHMIHASDHDEAPKLMYRAYHRAIGRKESPQQLGLPGI
jgi:three-Cys-motif partner protein